MPGDAERSTACAVVLSALRCAGLPGSELPAFEARLVRHFKRLPSRYAADVQSAEDVATHMALLDAVRDAPAATGTAVAVRAVNFTPAPLLALELTAGGSTAVGGGIAGSPPAGAAGHNAPDRPSVPDSPLASSLRTGASTKRPPTFGSSLNLLTLEDSSPRASGGLGAAPGPGPAQAHAAAPFVAHEVAVAARNRPRLLSALTTVLGELGLNINEAHVFCSEDGLALDVFVVDGWLSEDADELHSALQERLQRLDAPPAPLRGDTVQPAAAAQPTLASPGDASGDWEVDTSRLQFLEKVASGSFGDLFRGMYHGQEVAIKVLRLAHHHDQAHLIREFMQELAVLRKVRHKHIVQLIGASTTPPKLCIVTEFMRRGSLLDFLHRHHPLRPAVQAKLALDVARGMDYLHRCNIIHRDLKAANLLMNCHDDCKVADFGVARVVDGLSTMTAETGTYRWMAPEVVSHQRYDAKCDVFSYGILLWEIVTGGAVPYAGFTPLQAAVGVVQKGLRPAIPEGVHPALQRLMASCWDAHAAARPDFSTLVVLLEALEAELAQGEPPAPGDVPSKADGQLKQGGFFARMRRHL